MDPVINSLVQSPLVRSMSTVPSKASSFVHGVRDNVPPFSYQKVVVQPWNNPSVTSQEQSHKFRLPQFGTLNRAYLRIQTVNQIPTADSTAIIEEDDYVPQLHTKGNLSDSSDGNYTALKGKFRLPWTHHTQSQMKAQLQSPFGGGGSGVVPSSVLVDPEDKAALLAPVVSGSTATTSRIQEPDARQGYASNAWNVCNILDEMRLTTNGKLIETVYGDTIPAEVVKMPQGLRDFYIRGMVGWQNGSGTGTPLAEPPYELPWDPSACHRDAYGRYTTQEAVEGSGVQTAVLRNQHAAFICPVPLSSLKSLPKNYQTRFVEDLELEVKMKDLARGFNEFTAGVDLTKHHKVELVLIYHNWHDNIENTIRNSNYKRGVPASVYSTNWVRSALTTKALSNGGTLTIPLTSRNLITELVIVAKSKNVGTNLSHVASLNRKSDYTMLMNRDLSYSVELVGSGKTIWSATNRELMGPDSADYDLVERKMSGGDAAYGGLERIVATRNPDSGRGLTYLGSGPTQGYHQKAEDITHSGVDMSFAGNMAIMRFGFQTTDEFYSGGIALQTISNPTLKITPKNTEREDGGWLDYGIEFDVYVKHANLVRIDSDTGAVSRTLDV